jgi:hypothetical protein
VNALARGARAAAALAVVTVREAARQRLWLVFVAVAVALAVATTRITAIDQSSRLKLAVVIVASALGFSATLLAMLVGASQLRRDLDSRVGMMLFAKPVSRLAYLGGRWCGLLMGIALGTAAVATLASGLIAWRFGGSPEMRRIAQPDDCRQIGSLGEAVAVRAGQQRITLGGVPGNAVRFHFSGLSRPGPEGIELLLRLDARAYDPGEPIDRFEVAVLASADGDAFGVIDLDPASPYGRGEGAAPGHVLMHARDEAHQDLSLDYCRLRLPAARVSASGESWVQVVRLEGRVAVIADRAASAAAAIPGGSFLANLLRASGVLLAQAGLLGGFSLLLASVANLGVSLLGGMTLYFAGNALWALKDTLLYGDPSRPAQRLIDLALRVLPDFDRFGVSAQLAAGHAVGWDVVAAAWGYYGVFAAIFLAVAWIGLSRREM